MDWWLFFAVFLYFVSAVLVIAEVFVPSGGIISICSLASLIAGIYIFFDHSPIAGWIGLIIAIIMIPTVLITAYKIFPNTRFGKTVTLSPSERFIGDAVPDTNQLQEMLGKTGEVVTPLRPVGMCDFSGKRLECVAETGYIEKGSMIKVLRVQGTQLTVRQIEKNKES